MYVYTHIYTYTYTPTVLTAQRGSCHWSPAWGLPRNSLRATANRGRPRHLRFDKSLPLNPKPDSNLNRRPIPHKRAAFEMSEEYETFSTIAWDEGFRANALLDLNCTGVRPHNISRRHQMACEGQSICSLSNPSPLTSTRCQRQRTVGPHPG